MHLNRDLAILIPGLTYGGSKSLGFLSNCEEITNQLNKGNINNVTFYISTWDHENNNTHDLITAIENFGLKYKLDIETYQTFDQIIHEMIYEDMPEFGKLWDKWLHEDLLKASQCSTVDYKRRHLSIYYKFYKVFHMTQHEHLIVRTKSNNRVNLPILDLLDSLEETLEWNQTNNKFKQPSNFNKELGTANELIRYDNWIACGINVVGNNGLVKVDENGIFGLRPVFEHRIFNYSSSKEFIFNGIAPIFYQQFLDNFTASQSNKNLSMAPIAIGSLVWGQYFTSKCIQIHPVWAGASSQDRLGKTHKMY